MKTPLISIIVPIYNVAPYLPRCLDSIVGQTYKNLEIILVDDGSTDNSLEICHQYAAKDSRMRVIHQENKGLAGARNTGLEDVHGEFVTFVDSDDWLDLHALENYLKGIQQTPSEVVWGNIQYVREGLPANDAQADYQPTALGPEEFAKSLCLRRDFSVCNKLFSRKLIGDKRFQTKYTQGEDLVFWTTLLPDIQTVTQIDTVVYFYFQRSSSLIHNTSIVHHQYNQEFGQLLYQTCEKCGFNSAKLAALSVWLLSSALYGGYILLYDFSNKYISQLQSVVDLFDSHRKFIFHNRIMWQPAKFCIQMWTLFPTFVRMGCRLPGINGFLRRHIGRFIGYNK